MKKQLKKSSNTFNLVFIGIMSSMILANCSIFSKDDGGGGDSSNSNSGSETTINCQIGTACLSIELNQCLASGGSAVASCNNGGGGNSSNSNNGSSNVNCQIGTACLSIELNQCLASGGSAVASCNNGGGGSSSNSNNGGGGSSSNSNNGGGGSSSSSAVIGSTNCMVYNVCYVNVPANQCANSSGTSVASCEVNTSSQLYCDYGPVHSDGGGCEPISNASTCKLFDGGLVTNKCGRMDRLYCDYGPKNSDGGGCYMIASQANCDTQWGRVVYQCPASSVGNNNYPILPSQPPDPPVGSGQLYCDFGPRHSDGGGCEPISYASQCNRLDGGLVANTCGRKDRLFCDYGPKNSYGGGCYMIASQANCNTADGGVVRSECPLTSL